MGVLFIVWRVARSSFRVPDVALPLTGITARRTTCLPEPPIHGSGPVLAWVRYRGEKLLEKPRTRAGNEWDWDVGGQTRKGARK